MQDAEEAGTQDRDYKARGMQVKGMLTTDFDTAAEHVLVDVMLESAANADSFERILSPWSKSSRPGTTPSIRQIDARAYSERHARLPRAAADFCFAEASPALSADTSPFRIFFELIMSSQPSSSNARWRKQAQQFVLAWGSPSMSTCQSS